MRLRVGSRASPLAIKQASIFVESAQKVCPDVSFEMLQFSTSGDRLKNKPLSDFGGKGLFTKELDEALLDGRIDIAVHSAKDMPTLMPEGIAISAYMEREDVRDAFVGFSSTSIETLPHGAVIGASSLRRRTQLALKRPDLNFVLFRGNVQTRLKKVKAGDVDGTFLAVAGLKRSGELEAATQIFEVDDMIPAVGQGALAVCTRLEDSVSSRVAACLNHFPTQVCVMAERTMLRALDGSCRTPIAGYAFYEKEGLTLTGFYATLDGKEAVTYAYRHRDPYWLGLHVASVLKNKLQEKKCP